MVSERLLHSERLTYGQMSGLRDLYYPHELPPCVKPDGCLRWGGVKETETELAHSYWDEDSPEL